MVKNGNGCKNARNSLVAATFEKANTYVFAAPIIRDREVGGSNPLAPTNNSHLINYIYRRERLTSFSTCGQFVDNLFQFTELITIWLRTNLPKTAQKRES